MRDDVGAYWVMRQTVRAAAQIVQAFYQQPFRLFGVYDLDEEPGRGFFQFLEHQGAIAFDPEKVPSFGEWLKRWGHQRQWEPVVSMERQESPHYSSFRHAKEVLDTLDKCRWGVAMNEKDREQEPLAAWMHLSDDDGAVLIRAINAVYWPEQSWGLLTIVVPYALQHDEWCFFLRPLSSQDVQQDREAYTQMRALYKQFLREQSEKMGWDTTYGMEGFDAQQKVLLVLPEEQKRSLVQDVKQFFEGAEQYRQLGLPYRRGVIFVGPPGNGKTTAARYVAQHFPKVYRMARCVDDDFNGVSDFQNWILRAQAMSPSILLLEDIDSLASSAHEGRSLLLNLLDGIGTKSDGVYIIATSNYPERIDKGFYRRPGRFDRVFTFDYPSLEQRQEYLDKRFGDRLPEGIRYQLAQRATRLSYADLNELGMMALWIQKEGEEVDAEKLVAEREALYLKHQKAQQQWGIRDDEAVEEKIADGLL